jgi:hypothetical protein
MGSCEKNEIPAPPLFPGDTRGVRFRLEQGSCKKKNLIYRKLSKKGTHFQKEQKSPEKKIRRFRGFFFFGEHTRTSDI